jgi:4a-hydroxytetrahydrobiopterin dehydratase
MAELLDDAAIDAALASLTGWRRQDDTLVKDVEVTHDAVDNLTGAIGAVADELNHHPDVSRTGEGLRLTLWSHSDGGITAKDVELAARIDQVLSGSAQDPPA